MVTVYSSVPLLSAVDGLGSALEVAGPVPTSEVTGQYRGFCLYERTLDRGGVLAFAEVRDRAQFFLDGLPLGTVSRELGERAIVIPSGGLLQVLVEDQGRVNYGPRIGESKGLIGPAELDGEELTGWQIRALDLENLDLDVAGPFGALAVDLDGAGGVAGPSLSFAAFAADGPGDRYLRLDGWTKGNAYVNGFNLGRYWSRGPQRTLYVPGPLIRQGRNVLAILELQGSASRDVRFVSGPDLGPDEK